ncbi:MAG: hypothetical protein HYY96_08640 [Candidatus Tectomicrobia bacterium]|nr:hypothetical protein [Candidatus Tectomicrobia bacterium]
MSRRRTLFLLVAMVLGFAASAPAESATPRLKAQAGEAPALGNFASLGPGGGGGVFAGVFHTTNPDIILLGMDIGGIFKTTDGGMSWRHVNQGGVSRPDVTAGAYGIEELIAHPSRGEVFLAATWIGLLRSDDAGETWRSVVPGPSEPPPPEPISFSSVAFSPATPGLVLAGTGTWHTPETGAGLYRSTDDGESFTRVQAPGIPEAAVIASLAFDTSDGSLFAATSAGLYRGTDNGASFTKLAGPFRHDHGQWIGVAGSGAARRYWYVLETLGEDGNPATWSGGVYRSADGVTWSEVADQPRIHEVTDEILRAKGARIHPANPAILYLNLRTNEALGGTYRYETAWTDLTANFPTTWNSDWRPAPECVAVSTSDPNLLLSCNENAVIKSADGGRTWTQLSTRRVGERWVGTGAEVTGVYDLQVSQGVLYAAFEDIGLWRSDDRGASWNQLIWQPTGSDGPDGVSEMQVHPTDSRRGYFGVSSWSNGLREGHRSLLFASTDGGVSMRDITPAQVPALAGRTTLAVVWGDTPATDTIYVAFHGDRLYASRDGGASWSTADDGMTEQERQVIYSLAIDPATPTTLYAGLRPDQPGLFGGPFGASGGLLRSTDGGRRWTRVQGYPESDVLAVRFAGSPRRLFVGGFTSEDGQLGRGALLVSDDGLTFTEVLGQPYVQDVIDAPAAPGALYAAASTSYLTGRNLNAGIYRSTDNGATWSRLQGLLPHNLIYSLAFYPDDPNRLLMGTFGDGIIAAGIAPAAPPPAASAHVMIKANGSAGPLSLDRGAPLLLTVSLEAGGSNGRPADWWVAVLTPEGLFWFTLEEGWVRSEAVRRAYAGPLFDLPSFPLPLAGLPMQPGPRTFFFGIDTLMDGLLSTGSLTFGSVEVQLR